MQNTIINVFKNFRERIYHFFSSRRDAAFELIDSLSSNTSGNSVADLSLNPVHRRNYCSITRVVDEFYPKFCDKQTKNNALTKILSEQCAPPIQKNFYLFGVDCTPNPRRYAPTQQDRGFVYAPNTIAGNKPVTIGHQYSIAAYLPEKAGENAPPWILPLACHRVTTDEKGPLIGMQQITRCLESQEKFKNKLCVVAADSAYSSPECLVESVKNTNQVQVFRVRSNRVFHYLAEEDIVKMGRKKQFGDPFKLKDEATWQDPDEKIEFTATTKKGKKQIIKIKCWNSIIMRGKNKANTSNHPFRLVQICVYKESGKLFFKKPLWLMVSGEKRLELSLKNIFDAYRQRFDIEHFFRFGKNKLLMDKSQTPDVEHEEAWWQLIMIAYAQLYLACGITKNTPKPWEKYLKIFKSSDAKISPTQVQKDFERIIRVFGTPAKPPKRLKNAPGRQKGEKQTPRIRYSVVQKSKAAQSIAVPP